MARTREYDEDTVRRALMETFLERGFADASLSDLEDRSGLNRRQLYNDFGDKRALFINALQDFSLLASEHFLVPLERSESGVAAIENTLFGLTRLADSPQGRLGCLVCNAAREPIATDPDVNTLVERYFRRIERGYRNAIKRAIALGEISAEENTRSLARLFLSVHVSVCVMSRAGESVAVLTDAAREAVHRLR